MTLFIAILLIAAFDLPSILYFVAVLIWIFHLNFHAAD